jgi:mitogen-activated protein kinase 15
MDKVTHQPVALKRIFGAFRDWADAQRTYREISFFQPMQANPHTIKFDAVHKVTNNLDLCVVFKILVIWSSARDTKADPLPNCLNAVVSAA